MHTTAKFINFESFNDSHPTKPINTFHTTTIGLARCHCICEEKPVRLWCLFLSSFLPNSLISISCHPTCKWQFCHWLMAIFRYRPLVTCLHLLHYLKMVPIIHLDKDPRQANEMTKDFWANFRKGFCATLFLTNLMIQFLHDSEKRLHWFIETDKKYFSIIVTVLRWGFQILLSDEPYPEAFICSFICFWLSFILLSWNHPKRPRLASIILF